MSEARGGVQSVAPPAPESLLASDPDNEAALIQAIEPWLAHMTWRRDFDAWRKRRVWQENYQEAALNDIERAVGGSLAGKSLLDLGAGMGGVSVALLRGHEASGLSLQAMDYNPDYCRIARLRARRYGLDLNIVVAAGEGLPYPANSFDCVVCMDVLEHVQDAARVIAEMFRVLRPGGVVLTTVPNRHAFRDPHYHLPVINWLPRPVAEAIIRRAGRSKEAGLLQDRQGLSELNTYTWGEFSKLARSMGFRAGDQVWRRISRGEIRQLSGWRRTLLDLALRTGLARGLNAIYRYGWQGTYQILLKKPR
jgi:ubiquinone/menaquinone biosynthesis C-methylase UbiE